jgi:septal ring factor EnvC (AmiA/AmiB activator)
LVAAVFFAGGLGAARYDEKNLRRVRAEIEGKRRAMDRLKAQSRKLDSEIRDTQGKLVAIGANIRQYERRLGQYDRDLANLRSQEAALSEKLSGGKRRMAEIVAVFENMSRVPSGFVLFGGRRAERLMQSSLLLRSIAGQLDRTGKGYVEDLAALKSTKEQIVAAKKNIGLTNSKVRAEREKISALVRSKKGAYAKMSRENRKMQDDIARLVAQSRTIEEFIRKSEKLGGLAGKSRVFTGRVPLPVDGGIATYFGDARVAGVKSKGLYLKPRAGAQVVAPADSDVVFAGSFSGYRNLLILRSIGDYYLVIGGMDEVYAATGQALAAGEPIGTVGSGELYVEVRENARPINPARYFKI